MDSLIYPQIREFFFSVSSRAGGLFLFFLLLTATKNDKTPVNYWAFLNQNGYK